METGSTKLTLKWWESTDNRWILFPMGQWCGALMCLCYKAEQAVVPTVGLTVIWDARSRACNVVCLIFMPNYPPNITHIMAGSHQLQSLKLTYSICVPGWVLKCLNLITAPGSVSNQPGSVTWLATAGISKIHAVSWRNHIENQTTKGAQNM